MLSDAELDALMVNPPYARITIDAYFTMRVPVRVLDLWSRQMNRYAVCEWYRLPHLDETVFKFWLLEDTPECKRRLNIALIPVIRSMDRYRRRRTR